MLKRGQMSDETDASDSNKQVTSELTTSRKQQMNLLSSEVTRNHEST